MTAAIVVPPRPRAFYVTVRDPSGRTIYALGPFARHRRALGLASTVRHAIRRANLDPFHAFGYGTSSLPAGSTVPLGALNGALSVGPCTGMNHNGQAFPLPDAVLARIVETVTGAER